MARSFTRASQHRIQVGTAIGPTLGPSTMALIARKASDPAAYAVPFSLGQADGSAWFMWTKTSTDLAVWNGSVDVLAPFGWAAADGWCLVAMTKATGTVTPRFHKYVFATGVWSHGDGGGTSQDRTPSGDVWLGAEETGAGVFDGYFDGDLEMAGIWDVVLTDSQIEELAFTLPAWFQVNPKILFKLDQDTVSQKVADISGNGWNQVAINGTAVASSSVPVFNYGAKILMAAVSSVAAAIAQSRAQDNPIANMYARGGRLRALALSLIYPPRQNSTLTSAVSSVAGMVIEALGGIFTTASEPIEAGQGVATTSQEPVEAAGGVASTGSLPLDEPGAIAATGVEPLESAQSVSTTGSEPLEARQGISTTGSAPLDEAGGIAATASEPIDAAQGVSSGLSAPIESQMAVNVTVVLTVEALGGLATSSSAPLDEAGGIASTGLVPLEALGGVASTGSEPYESDGSPVVVVSQTGVVVIEALAGIQATASMPAEALGGVATPDSVPIESNQAVSSSGSFPIDAQLALSAAFAPVIEALGGIARATGVPLDEAGGVANTGPAPVESIQPLSTTAGMVLDAARAVAAVAVTFPLEALLGAAAVMSLPIEGFGVIIHWHYGSGTTITYDSDGNWTYHSDDTATYDTEEDGQ